MDRRAERNGHDEGIGACDIRAKSILWYCAYTRRAIARCKIKKKNGKPEINCTPTNRVFSALLDRKREREREMRREKEREKARLM